MRRSPFQTSKSEPEIAVPTLYAEVILKRGGRGANILPFGGGHGFIVSVRRLPSKGGYDVNVKLANGVVVRNVSFSDCILKDARAYLPNAHEYDLASNRLDSDYDPSAPKQFRPSEQKLSVPPIVAKANKYDKGPGWKIVSQATTSPQPRREPRHPRPLPMVWLQSQIVRSHVRTARS